LALLLLATLALGVTAQDDEIASGFKKLDAVEAQRLRAVLAQPVPSRIDKKILNAYFTQKNDAAHRHNDEKTHESILRQLVEAVSDAFATRDMLASLLYDSGQFYESIELRLQSIALASAACRPHVYPNKKRLQDPSGAKTSGTHLT
jgi:hypothetical protein